MSPPGPVLVTGGGGLLGRTLVNRLAERGFTVHSPVRSRLDVTDAMGVSRTVGALAPGTIVHCAAATAVDRCEREPGWAWEQNVTATANVVDAARTVGARVVLISTDYVFDGTSDRPYLPGDTPAPLGEYGRTKLEAERLLAGSDLVVRTAWLNGPRGLTGSGVVHTVLDLVRAGRELTFVDDQVGSPSFVDDVAPVLVELIGLGASGIHHVVNSGTASWFELARETVRAAGLDPALVRPVSTADLEPPREAIRPRFSALDCSGLSQFGIGPLRPWREALHDLVVGPGA